MSSQPLPEKFEAAMEVDADRVRRQPRQLRDLGAGIPLDQTQGQGTWTVTSAYAGNSQYTAASAGPCTVAVAVQPG